MDKLLNLMNKLKKDSFSLYKRDFYISKIEKYLNTNLIKVLIWERRVWKSYIMKTIIEDLIKKWFDNNIFYVNFEIDNFEKLKSRELFKEFFEDYFLKQIDENKKIYVFLDEVQEMFEWQIFVNSLLAKYWEKIDIFISWSNSKMLSWELSTYLSWRYIEFLILPFSLNEYFEFTNESDLIKYLKNTWLPEALKLYKLNDFDIITNYFKSLKNTVLLKDIVERYKIKDVYLLEKIFIFLVDNISNFSSLNSIVKKLKQEWIKTNTTTLWSYIMYLEQTFLIYSVEKYDVKWKKLFENEKKYYLNDLWFKNYLTSNYDLWLSKSFENYVFLVLKRFWYNIYIWKIWALEIDFIWEKWWKKIYVQVCIDLSNETVFKREVEPFFQIEDKQNFYVITIWKNFVWNYKWIDIVEIEQFEKFCNDNRLV